MQNATVDMLSKNNANGVNTDKSSRNIARKNFQTCLILLHYVDDNPGQGTSWYGLFMWVDANLLIFG